MHMYNTKNLSALCALCECLSWYRCPVGICIVVARFEVPVRNCLFNFGFLQMEEYAEEHF